MEDPFWEVSLRLMEEIHKKKSASIKKKKKKSSFWLENCKLEELKELCRAAKLKVSGTKPELVTRICEADREKIPEDFIYNTLGYLKNQCREKGLIVSGKVWELVVRLLQDKHGTGQPKRTAGTFDEETGVFQPKKRAKSMKLPNVEKISERAYKKAYPGEKVTDKWGKYTSREHCLRCLQLATNIIDKEVFEKELFQRSHEDIAWKVIFEVLRFVTWDDKEKQKEYYARQNVRPGGMIMIAPEFKPSGMGVACDYIKIDVLPRLMKAIGFTSSDTKLEELAGKLLRAFHREIGAYSIKDKNFSKGLIEKNILPNPNQAQAKTDVSASAHKVAENENSLPIAKSELVSEMHNPVAKA